MPTRPITPSRLASPGRPTRPFRPTFEAKGEKRPAPFARLPSREDLASIDGHEDNNNSVLEGVVSGEENETPRRRGQRRKYAGRGATVAGGCVRRDSRA